jgi:AraC family transcriptional regulator, regulatory protein of adaptative response / DNA-3-methyladenine glycosylase II
VSAPADAFGLDREVCYRALRTRDARFDGRFYTAVRTTGIYCRPVCPARTPKLENCLFLPSAAAAQRLGFRPCLRCRPEAAPGTAVSRGSANTVARALHLIAEGGLVTGDLDPFAERLGIGARQLRRLFERHVGASPVQVAQTQRLLFAKKLLSETRLPITQIALAAGFGSVRRFNAAFAAVYARPPSAVRAAAGATGAARAAGATRVPEVELELPYAPPYDFDAVLEFLGPRAIRGTEEVAHGRYRRAFALGEAFGSVEVRAHIAAPRLLARIRCTELRALGAIVARLRRVFDLDADSRAIDELLRRDPALAVRVGARPGVRVPGAWDGFELAVRAVLGQQVSVAAATTFAGRIVERYGQILPEAERLTDGTPGAPRRLFPDPRVLARADLAGIGLTRARADTLRALARAVCDDPRRLSPARSLHGAVRALMELPGVGAWTAHYIAMRALNEPDAFPAADLGLARALHVGSARPNVRELEARAEAFRPFRAYAAMRLWLQPTAA